MAGEYEVIGIFEKDPGMFGGPGIDTFAMIPFSLFRKQYPEAKELILAFSVSEGRSIRTRRKDEVTEAHAALASCKAQPGKRLRVHLAGLPRRICGRS